MFALLKQFWNDPTFAARIIKACLLAAAMAVGTGQIPELPPWLGAGLAALAAIIKSGDANPTIIKDMTPEQEAKLRQLLS